MKLPVLNHGGVIVRRASADETKRMLLLGQAAYTADGRSLQLLELVPSDRNAGRTHTSRGGLLAAIGRSQQYTTAERGHVTGFKRIFAEDRPIFNAAVLDCLTS